MKGKRYFIGVLILAVVLGVSFSISRAQEAGPRGAQGPDSVDALLNSRISYQGVLQEDGVPVTGSYNITFKLYTSSTCSSGLLQTVTKTGVAVENGLFAVGLDVNQSYFNGQGLWLSAEVAGEQVSCKEIMPAPYALSLRPGALIRNGSVEAEFVFTKLIGPSTFVDIGVAAEGSWAIYGHSTDNIGVYGESDGTSGTGVEGVSNATIGTNYGVYGHAQSTSGYGGYFTNGASSGNSIGVYGRSESSTGWGVQGVGTGGMGVYGLASTGIGVEGYATSAVSGVGVFGMTNGTAGWGVYGFASSTAGGHGVFAQSKGVGGDGAALWATADNAAGIAIWGHNDSSDSTLVLENFGAGDLIKAFLSGGELRFLVDNSGTVYSDGGFHTPASDFAEMLPGVDGLEPGDVLAIGMDGKLHCSSTAFQTSVVGVYSTKPGIVGGYGEADQEGNIPLAVVGIVPVKVSAEHGAILPGDLLVTSSTAGYAMRAGANPPQGTVIGKALESLDAGTGTILVLVTLQ